MATFLKGNRVEAAKTETVVEIDIDTGRNDRDVEMGDNTVADKRGSGTEQVGHHFQADLGLDLKVSAEKEQEQPTGKQKKTTWKTKSRQETFEEQAEPDKSSQAQGQAINGNDIEQGDQLFERICSTKDDDEIEDLIDVYTGGMNNSSQTHSGLLKKVSEFDYSTQGLLQFLATHRNTLADNGKLPNENILIENVQKILKHLDEATILQASEKKDKLTLLHYAALYGSTKLIDLLLKKNKRIQYLAYKHSPSGIPLEIAIQRKHDETAKTLVNLMTRKSIVSLFWKRESQIKSLNRESQRKSPTIKQLLKSNLTHTTSAVLDQFIEQDGWLLGPLELDNYNRHPTDSNYEQKHKTAYQMLANSNIKLETLQAFANHECVKELTNNKWNNYASKLFWIPCCWFFVAWVALTTAAVMGVMAEALTTYDKPLDYVRGGCEAFAYIYSFVTFLGEILQFKLQGRMYWCDGYNYLDIFSSLLILIVLPLRMTHQNAQWGIFAVGYILGTLRVIQFMTMSRRLGQLGFIIQRLVFDVLKFGLYFLVILLSFSGGLLLALKGDDSLNVHDDTSTFWGILFVGVRVLVETQPIDDIEYTGPNGYRALSCAIMMIFLALTYVVMLNIFIAQLSSRFNNEHESVDLKFETHRAITIAKYELGENLMSYIRLFSRNPCWVACAKRRTSEDNNDTLSHTDVDGGCLSATMRCFRSCCSKFFGWTVVIFLLLILLPILLLICPFLVYLYCSEDKDEDEDED